MANNYLPPGVSDAMIDREAREHDPKYCEEGNNGDKCDECKREIAELELARKNSQQLGF